MMVVIPFLLKEMVVVIQFLLKKMMVMVILVILIRQVSAIPGVCELCKD